MKWQVKKAGVLEWFVSDPACRAGDIDILSCRCKWFDSWRDAIRYAVWHATGQQEPLS